MQLKYLFFALALLFTSNVSGQDLHFTQFHLAPMNLNPALTGSYLGSYRLGGLYRDQYRSVNTSNGGDAVKSAKPYQTVSVFVDSPIIGGFRKQDWIGVGANLYYDQAGSALIRNVGTMFSLAYHLGLGKKGKSVFTLGVQYGSVQRKLDTDQMELVSPIFLEQNSDPFLDQLMAQAASSNQGSGGNANLLGANYNHWNIGTLFTSELGKNADMRAGVSVAHFTRPGQAFNGSLIQDRRNVRTTGFLTFYSDIGDRFTFIPGILIQNSGNTTELAIQTRGALLINEEKEISLTGGLGFRVVNAADLQVMVGMDYKNIRVGLAYDINLASFTEATNGSSGFELGVTYLGKIYKKPKVDPLLICPRL